MNLSPNFTLEEMVRSQTALRIGITNTPNDAQVQNLIRLSLTVLEPSRALFPGCFFHTDSGFRCSRLNALVGGAGNSAHLDGRAADEIPQGVSLQDAFNKIRASNIPFDQLIIECDEWLHFSVPILGVAPRRECLIATGTPGKWKYEVAP